MKPANFPARKNTKRIEALSRQLDSRTYRKQVSAGLDSSIVNTEMKIVPHELARAIRTKKHR
jgi:hypothetical protein